MTAVPLSSLSLFPGTREQIIESRTRSYASWGRGTTLQEYLERDARTDNHEVSRNNKLMTWVLARRDSPGSLDFMCSCETYWREGLVRAGSSTDPNLKNKENEVEVVDCCAVASVFTPAINRGKGYARHMMRLLHWVVAPSHSLPKEFPAAWGTPPQRPSFIKNAAFSVLYSDVGPTFYHAGPSYDKEDGWKVVNPVSTIWSVSKAHELLSPIKNDALNWKWFDEDSINGAWKVDEAAMKEEMSKVPASGKTLFSYLPTKGVAGFQHHRLQQFWVKMNPKPIYWGISLASDSESTALDLSTFASWTLDFRPPTMNSLIITRLRSNREDFKKLLAQVVDFAKKHSIEEVEVWNLPSALEETAHSFGGKTIVRDEHLSSFKWYGHEKNEDVSWLYNEKFCWC
ncbi:hypothetical protein BDN70DRAFT_860403 [Pholiota conissans]|uniref:LYC1 C-terminal domain-containing protein n=1 Tax=Pholiota conissans TaxID=109636 RepID=A0A9P5YYW4_9AGAR|nr:hypothetical protein BDN70DRAFT_860403 [Pholiota conissans]